MKPIKETDKAVCVNIVIHVHKRGKDRFYREQVWIPKSQICDDSVSEWYFDEIYKRYCSMVSKKSEVSIMLTDADGEFIPAIETEQDRMMKAKREHLFQMGRLKHDALVQQAKSLGIKGVRSNLKTTTLEYMIETAKTATTHPTSSYSQQSED